MNVVVFLGPSLAIEEARSVLDAVYLPPAAQGDVYRATRQRPFAIGIIDGYFERLPAVWHKEILWALSQGTHVFGGASMGALRAAELDSFGMKGVGPIYEQFRAGILEDDDEVAVAHADASRSYRASSAAMVNIRATLQRAQAEGLLDSRFREELESHAKATFYPERSYAALLAYAQECGLSADRVVALREFFQRRAVDQKREDALAVLAALRDCVAQRVAAPRPVFRFSHTEVWEQVVEWAEAQPALATGGDPALTPFIAAEVRLMGASGRAVLAKAMARAVSAAARRRREPVTQRTIDVEDERLRTRLSIREDAAQAWLRENHLTEAEYAALLERQVEFSRLIESSIDELDRYLLDELRTSGLYASIAARAAAKQRDLAVRGLLEATVADTELSPEELLRWYLERLGLPCSAEVLQSLAETLFADRGTLEREAIREYLSARVSNQRGTG